LGVEDGVNEVLLFQLVPSVYPHAFGNFAQVVDLLAVEVYDVVHQEYENVSGVECLDVPSGHPALQRRDKLS
jgi:hypothetical protein